MKSERFDRAVLLYPTGKTATVQRESHAKADEVLIEEILKAAGLEPMD